MTKAVLSSYVDRIERQSSLGELAYERLKDIIISGAFPPNQKMTVRSVAQALGVSTTPARDAVIRLLAEGALVNEGPKTVVLPALNEEALDEIYATRLALEGLAAERAVKSITKKDIAELRRLQELINSGLSEAKYDQVLKANRQFHFLIYRRSNWPRLVGMIESLWLQIGPSLNDLYPDYAQTRRGVSNHMIVFGGLEENDPAKVRLGIEQDLADGHAQLKAFVAARQKKVG
jgi:DNA-binding GntR family transcriptional regulator